MKSNKVFIIAEAGVNHNGDLQNALKLVDVAVAAGADAVKFQTFKSGECTGKFAVKVDYLENTTQETQTRFELTQSLILPFEQFIKIKEYCESKNILFLTTPDGQESLDFITDRLNVPIIKVSSTELTNLKFIEMIAAKGLPIILSTGIGNLGEIEKALEVIEPYNIETTILHCTSEYPAPIDEVNIKAMKTISKAFGIKVGFSDHTVGNEASIAAVALGATVIEKHFTLDKQMPGPDHKASLDPDELSDFVKKIRNTEVLLGDGRKKASLSELKNREGIRRSVVAARPLSKGTILCEKDFTFKRPGYGIHPYDVQKIIGFKVNKDLEADEPILWKYLH